MVVSILIECVHVQGKMGRSEDVVKKKREQLLYPSAMELPSGSLGVCF